jgi:hypothetical protein
MHTKYLSGDHFKVNEVGGVYACARKGKKGNEYKILM